MSTPPLSVKKLTTKRTSADQSGLNLMVVVVLGLVSIVCVIGVIMLALGGKPTPEFLVAIGSAAGGDWSACSCRRPKTKRNPDGATLQPLIG